ncbi:MAG: PrpF family protein [Alphaproteobacteria bacterium]|nr:PrpF family protein [Alphaproteobacteria bacterium]
MAQRAIPAAFIRGGTSKGLFFHERDLPTEPAARDRLFLAAIGSPDPNGRQLDGMGGGISSLSKVVFVAPSARVDADVDYTFAQVAVDRTLVDYHSNCGNLTSAVGPFAIDEGLLRPADGWTSLRLFNRNSGKTVVARFAVAEGRAVTAGDFALQGVAGSGAPIRLDFQQPGGAVTGRLLPTGSALDRLDVPGVGQVEASLVDATTAAVFVSAGTVGWRGTELPDELERDRDALLKLEAVRRAAAVAMGLPADSQSVPKIAVLAPAAAARTLSGETLPESAMHLTARMLSMGRPHRALPLTGAMCLAVAARLPGSLPQRLLAGAIDGDIRIGQPSGILPVNARVLSSTTGAGWQAAGVEVIRTQRRLMDGQVYVSA